MNEANDWIVSGRDGRFIAISLLVGMIVSYTTFHFTERLKRESGGVSLILFLVASLGLGVGLWATHFLGLIAWALPQPFGFDRFFSLAALAVAILGSCAALSIFVLKAPRVMSLPFQAMTFGLLMALAAGGTHLLLLTSLRQVEVWFGPFLSVVGLFTGFLMFSASLWLSVAPQLAAKGGERLDVFRRLAAAALMGLTMAVVRYPIVNHLALVQSSSGERSSGYAWQVTDIGIVTLMVSFVVVLGLTVLSALLDSRLRTTHQELALREEGHRLVLEAANDGVWDWDLVGGRLEWNEQLFNILGLNRASFPLSYENAMALIHPEDFQRVTDSLQRHLNENTPYMETFRLRHATGEYRVCLVRGNAIRDEGGNPVRMPGVLTDITDLRRAEEELRLLQSLTLAVVNADILEGALREVLRKVSETTGWALGQVWFPDEEGRTLWCHPTWHVREPGFEAFRECSESLRLSRGEGLPGRVWATGAPEWIWDLSKASGYPRAKCAALVGIRSAMAAPVIADGGLIAVIEFFTSEARREDERLVELVSAIGAQLGGAIERKRMDEALRKAHEELELTVAERTLQLSETNASLLEEIQERKRVEADLQKNSRLLSSIVENIPVILLLQDAKDLRYEMFNKAGLDFLRQASHRFAECSQEEIRGKSLEDFFSEEHAEFWVNLEREALARKKMLDYPEIDLNCGDAGDKSLHARLVPILDNRDEPQYLMMIGEDITEAKRNREKIQALNSELESQVVTLNAVNRELETFSYSVSHDLRAPLRSIDGFSQALLEDYSDVLDDIGKDYLRRVRTNSQRMARLIDDMLNLSRLTRGELHLQRVNLSEQAESVATELREKEPGRNVRFVIQQGLTVEGDERLLRSVLENLLGNAWKYTGKRENALIEFGRVFSGEAAVYFVRDNGVGFDMTYADKLFSAFQRLHRESEFPGTGIGLATVQRIVHRHGGRVWAEGEVERGATFYFSL